MQKYTLFPSPHFPHPHPYDPPPIHITVTTSIFLNSSMQPTTHSY